MKGATAARCERVLGGDQPSADRDWENRVISAWRNSQTLTPRQAAALVFTLDGWADLEIAEWIQRPDEPLHEVAPFACLDRRVLIFVNENRAWAAKVQERCYALADEIQRGQLPFHRDACYFDEVLLAAAVTSAPDMLQDMPDLFESIPARHAQVSEDDYYLGDEDWDIVSDGFDDVAAWDDWEVPAMNNHPLLPAIIATRHPFTWFDVVGPRPSMRETAAEWNRLHASTDSNGQ